MKPDPFRTRLRELLRRNGLNMRQASLAIGRNHSFLQQYLTREHPRVLRHGDSEALANLLGCEPGELRHPVVPPRRPAKRQRRRPPAGTPVAEIPELVGAAADGCLARNEAVPRESPRWYLPDAMLRQETGANPGNLRIVRVRGDAMEPLLSEGDRLVIDTARRRPTTGELCVLWDGNGLAVRRVEIVHGTEPAQWRLTTANPNYAPIMRLAREARIVATVLWIFRRP
ncbi:S24 family peptidase [Candidatus Rariloculus sp.]|uniref:S24 family peptidase n=1 Tax=Candidatus Rariloculus sp. TaxID=3101265 RepID=UPI003D115DC2